MSKNTDRKLRSQDWYSGHAYENYARRAWLRAEGFPADVFQNKPVIGICNSWSELNNCNAHLRIVAEAVKRGVWAAGGVPLEFPTISLGESLTITAQVRSDGLLQNRDTAETHFRLENSREKIYLL